MRCKQGDHIAVCMGQVLVYVFSSIIIINSFPFHSQSYPSLDDNCMALLIIRKKL